MKRNRCNLKLNAATANANAANKVNMQHRRANSENVSG